MRRRRSPRSTGALLYDHPPDTHDQQSMYKLVEMRHHLHNHNHHHHDHQQQHQQPPLQDGSGDALDDSEVTKVVDSNTLSVRMPAGDGTQRGGRSPTLDILKGTPQTCTSPAESEAASYSTADNWHPEDVYRTRAEIYQLNNSKCFATVGRTRPRCSNQEQLNVSVPNVSLTYFRQ